MHIAEFIRKFSVFLPTNLKTNDSNNTIKDHRQCVSEIMGKADLDETLYKIGISQVNFILYTYLLFNNLNIILYVYFILFLSYFKVHINMFKYITKNNNNFSQDLYAFAYFSV